MAASHALDRYPAQRPRRRRRRPAISRGGAATSVEALLPAEIEEVAGLVGELVDVAVEIISTGAGRARHRSYGWWTRGRRSAARSIWWRTSSLERRLRVGGERAREAAVRPPPVARAGPSRVRRELVDARARARAWAHRTPPKRNARRAARPARRVRHQKVEEWRRRARRVARCALPCEFSRTSTGFASAGTTRPAVGA